MSQSEHDLALGVAVRATDQLAGVTGFHHMDFRNRHCSFGISIGEKAEWGKGYGTDAMRILMRLGFDKMNLHRLWLHVFDYNQRAIASYEKCGFKREGVLREEHFARGKYHDTIVMGILESEYRALA